MGRTVKIGTRGSKLALYQANLTKSKLENHFPELDFKLEIIHTKGDKILDVALSKIGDKGLFTKEIETALLDGRIDIAVHSMKDLPTLFPKGLKLAAVLERGEPREALVSTGNRKLSQLTETTTKNKSSFSNHGHPWKRGYTYQKMEIRLLYGHDYGCCRIATHGTRRKYFGTYESAADNTGTGTGYYCYRKPGKRCFY